MNLFLKVNDKGQYRGRLLSPANALRMGAVPVEEADSDAFGNSVFSRQSAESLNGEKH